MDSARTGRRLSSSMSGTTAVMTLLFLGRLDGLGIGTVLAAATMGKAIAWIGSRMDRYVTFTSILDTAT